jgi:hypothetical protein
MILHNEHLRPLVREKYSREDIRALRVFLQTAGTFHFPALPTGLFPAVPLSERGQYTGYDNCWYYLRQGSYVPNDVTPLLWTQANLLVALDLMEKTAPDPSSLTSHP